MNIILHHPLPLDPEARSASGIRPLKMLSAFRSLGCRVELVTGYASERKKCIERIRKKIKQGVQYDFVYSESSTMPTILTEVHHLPLNPLMDFLFFRFCKRNAIPIGLFYRDIYWLFESYGKGLNPVKSAIAKIGYQFDLWVYERTLSKLYLPSLEMGAYVPRISSEKFAALPPGHSGPSGSSCAVDIGTPKRLKLFYVGGMSSHYQLHKLFSVVRDIPEVEFTLCTREAEWQAVEGEYPGMTPNIKVIHATGDAMETELKAADIAVLFVEPLEYWEFASPVKLYEYLGYQKPILASEGTLAGRFVCENGIGWSLPYEEAPLKELLCSLLAGEEDCSAITANLKRVAPQHLWVARAEQVVGDLTL